MSIEVFDGPSSAASWADAWGDTLVETALGCGALDWSWHRGSFGTTFEVAFADAEAWERYRESLRNALDAVPDPVSGLLVYRGRGGSSGMPSPKRPRPLMGAGAASLPLPLDEEWLLAREQFERPAHLLSLG
ncbi:MAG: hypothetical protein KY454_01700 [Actinobacteria bacterium]|nr:hypothetical protein [Actinomycetota bacterium]MBW3651145.1 hypothetical protein [Actinomycetota bacterium]